MLLRALQFSDAAKELYNLPHGLDGDRFDPCRDTRNGMHYLGHPDVGDWPTDGQSHPERSIRNGIFGRNVAAAYDVEPDVARGYISCDEVQKIRDSYILNEGTPRESVPYASNQAIGRRADQEVIDDIFNNPWSP